MTYSQWLESISNFFPKILSWLNTLINSLLNNYIIITILGFSLFTSFFSLVLYVIRSMKKDDDFDNIK